MKRTTAYEQWTARVNKARTPPPEMLLEMRFVLEHPVTLREPEMTKTLRASLKQSPKSFMERLTKLESEWMALERAVVEKEAEELRLREAVPAATIDEVDAGTEKVLALLAAEWEKVRASC